MNHEIMKAILEKIKAYDRIMLFRHIRIDGDCVGSTKGLKAIIQATWPEKEVLIVDDETSDYLAFLGPDDAQVADEIYKDALGIVLDTASTSRISNQKYSLCKELIKIDHHIPVENYGDLIWVEEKVCSASELIVKFYDTFRDELIFTPEAAYFLYTGMVTDSGRFKYHGVDGDTLRRAAILLDQGIDIDTLYANLYMEDFSALKFKAYVYEKIQLTENGVAYVYIDKDMQEKFHLTREEASASVDFMDKIRNTLCWLAFVDSGDENGSIRVRLRSRFMSINHIAEQFNGGGHACASGATVYSQEEMLELISKADTAIKEYKETHEGWL
ncbi:MAG: bifunctional oligoribonuclease/PAP phosphatase NrnA [Agathobacter sp.]|nr:bifunctional oligoribonuclease/PAP phosphatase NrnA [Agathobacter sp.]